MAHSLIPDWKDRIVFSQGRPQPQVLEENDRFKVILAGLEAGQRIPVHPEAGSVYYILEGSGWMTVDGERLPVKAGTTITMEEGAARGLEAESALAFLAVRVAEAASAGS